jgi:hypothetical protein
MSDTHKFSLVKRRWTTVRLCDLCAKESHDDTEAKAHYFAEHIRSAAGAPTKSASLTREQVQKSRHEGQLLLACLDNICEMNRSNIIANSRHV